uniref:Crossover junction endonuclease MUS81-like HHH domain-containing protein n=1 Tax=Globisporangium ultimum (strain ATCC 200006 / CBS 805.95 / DAOM BR144) TaxID=431595 RepID=K3WML2_GLOUD
MSREASKKAAKELLELCGKEGVKVPTEMITKFGKKESASKKRKADDVKAEKKPIAAKSRSKKADDAEGDEHGKKAPSVRKTTKKTPAVISEDDEDDDEPKTKKARTKPTATNEANQELADAFAELSGFEFKRGEKFKGGTWSKVAKAVRDSEDKITSGKQAMKLKGIGKSSATRIDEFLETGTMSTLEEYRAGNM